MNFYSISSCCDHGRLCHLVYIILLCLFGWNAKAGSYVECDCTELKGECYAWVRVSNTSASTDINSGDTSWYPEIRTDTSYCSLVQYKVNDNQYSAVISGPSGFGNNMVKPRDTLSVLDCRVCETNFQGRAQQKQSDLSDFLSKSEGVERGIDQADIEFDKNARDTERRSRVFMNSATFGNSGSSYQAPSNPGTTGNLGSRCTEAEQNRIAAKYNNVGSEIKGMCQSARASRDLFRELQAVGCGDFGNEVAQAQEAMNKSCN